MGTSTSQKNKVIHTYNYFDKAVVRYENSKGEKETREIKVDWYFAIHEKDKDEAIKIMSLHGIKAHLKADSKFPDYYKIYYNPRKTDERYDLVLLLEKGGVKTYEGDLNTDRRWYIDKEIEVSDNYRKLYFDIETDDTLERIEVGRDRVISWAAIDDRGKRYFEKITAMTDEAEKELLIKFLKRINKYDLLLGWNSSQFDVPYLKDRMRRFDLHKTKLYCWRQVAHFDLLKRFRHIFRFDSHLKSFSLEFVSNHFLGKGKVPRAEKTIELWNSNQEKLEEYNIQDSVLVKELDDKLGVSNMMIRQSQWCGVPAGQFGLYSIIDAHIMKTAHRLGKFCETSLKAIEERSMGNVRGNENPGETDTEKAKYAGALVLDPVVGKYDGVHTFDFKGLYPSMMRTSNIGYDTIRYEPSGDLIRNPGTEKIPRKAGGLKPTYFIKDPSVINVAISELITKRTEYKKLKLQMIEDGTNKGTEWERVVSDEIIVKELANSTYGIMGLEYGRYFSVDVAESITLFGQWCILFAKEYFEKQKFQVIYGDTDSVFVVTGKKVFDVEKQLDGFHGSLKETLKNTYNIDECYIQLEFDKKYESLILIEKKTYVGHVTNIEGKKTDDIYARGLEFIKKNTFSFAGDKQKQLIEYILHHNPTRKDVKSLIIEMEREFNAKNFTREELTITQKVGKDPDDYSGTAPLHVRLAQKVKEKTGQNLIHSEIDYIVTGQDGKMKGVLADEFDGTYDKKYYWDNKTQPLLERVLSVVYPDYDFFEKQLNLFDDI